MKFRFGTLVEVNWCGMRITATIRDPQLNNRTKTIEVFDGSRRLQVKPEQCKRVLLAR